MAAAAPPFDPLDPAQVALRAIGGRLPPPAPIDAAMRALTPADAAILGPPTPPPADPAAAADPNRPLTGEDHAVLGGGAPLAANAQGPAAAADPNRPLSHADRQLLQRVPSVTPLVETVPARPAEMPTGTPQAGVQGRQTPVGGEAARVQFDAASGAVLDPLTHLPMQRGQPVEARAVPLAEQAVNLATPVLQVAQTVANLPFRILSILANPVHAALQTGLQRAGQQIGQHPGESDAAAWLDGLRGFFQGVASPEAGRAAWNAFVSPEISLSSPFSVPGIRERPIAGIKPGSVTDTWVRGLGNFAFNALTDELTGKVQGPMVAQLMRIAGRAGELAGLNNVRIPLPGGAKSINDIRSINAGNRQIAHIMAKHEGLQGPVQEAAIAATERANAAYERLQKLGVPLTGKGASGQKINILDEYVYHWIEAGADGAAYTSRREVERLAEKLSTDPRARGEIVKAVREIGDSYSKAWVTVGRSLEKAGYLKPGTVDRMGGYYAARMYEATSHNPDDIEAWLKYADEIAKTHPNVGVAEGALRNAEQILGASGARGGVATAAKGRKLQTYEERVAQGAVTQASPVFAKSIKQQTRIAARGGALGEIAQSDLAQPGFVETPIAPKFTPEAYTEASKNAAAAETGAAAARTEYQAAKTAAATDTSPEAAQRLEQATAQYKEALGTQRAAQRQMRGYRGLVDTGEGAKVPASAEEYRTAAQTAAQARQTEATAAQQAYKDAVAAYRKAGTPENELAVLKTRAGVRDAGIAAANAENKIREVEQEIATGQSGVTRTQVPVPPGSKRLLDRRYGPLDGMIVPDHVKTALDAYLNPAAVEPAFLEATAKLARFFKGQAMFLSFPSLLHKVKYDSVLAEGAAKDAGLSFSPAAVTRAAQDLVRFRRGGKLTPAIEALRNETRAFVPHDDSLYKIGGSLRNVLGLSPKVGPDILAGYRKAGRIVPESIGEIERTYKIALTETLAKKYGYPEAARRAAETIGDWTMTDPTIHLLEKYGGVPFLTARAKAFPKMLNIALKHPEILQRWGHPKLGASISAAMSPAAQAQQQEAPAGSIPIPGAIDFRGRQQFITRDPLRVEPISDLWGLMPGEGGVIGAARDAQLNVDARKTERAGEAKSIVKPGELPPLDSAEARFRYVAERLKPGALRSIERTTRAVEGKTKFGGPYTDPETLAQAITGIVTGADVGTPKSETQRKQDAARAMMLPQARRAIAYANGYTLSLLSGNVKPRNFPGAENGVKTVADAKAQIKNAQARLKDIADGQQFKGQEQIDELKRQSEWVYTLHQIGLQRLDEERRRNAVQR